MKQISIQGNPEHIKLGMILKKLKLKKREPKYVDLSRKLCGIDLFSGIGGITHALSDWVRPVVYCDNEPFAQAVLLERMQSGDLPIAPIWDDVTTLNNQVLEGFPKIDIIYGGFPCQDISSAGTGKGLAGDRSGLFFEIVRLAREIRPAFLFLENVSAIRTRGLRTVGEELAAAGYDCRWDLVSAAEMGARHRRERWFLLAYSKSGHDRGSFPEKSEGQIQQSGVSAFTQNVATGKAGFITNSNGTGLQEKRAKQQAARPEQPGELGSSYQSANTDSERCKKLYRESFPAEEKDSRVEFDFTSDQRPYTHSARLGQPTYAGQKTSSWWRTVTPIDKRDWPSAQPGICGGVNGLPQRMDRVASLGNSVYPPVVKEAFKRLVGLYCPGVQG